jgi:aspartyl-tRNA(Asn)/glutamyl-tRNA(Gln) amidotransferase subunit B
MKACFEPVIGLEVHAELKTKSKMFCSCPVVDSTLSMPNMAVCPICAGMPGVLPVVNQQAVEHGLRVALALDCKVAPQSIFARKNYFYPDLPKGYQISQFEFPLAVSGHLTILTSQGPEEIRIRRVHLEEDTGKLTHIHSTQESYSLVDLNRAGVPLLEIVSEPDLHSLESVRAYATTLQRLLRYLGASSADMEKGAIRFEANVSIRECGTNPLGTRVEIKNLNSFKALEKSVAYEIERQTNLTQKGEKIRQETLGWDETNEVTFSQRGKEEAHDYRYFPEPDLPPLVIEREWIDLIQAGLPELPQAKADRFIHQYGLSRYDANLLIDGKSVADYFENILTLKPDLPAKTVANWILGDLFSLVKQNRVSFEEAAVPPPDLASLIEFTTQNKINAATAKSVLAEMWAGHQTAAEIIADRQLDQVSDTSTISAWVSQVLAENPTEVTNYMAGKETLGQWFFGQVMRMAKSQANPQVVKAELKRQLEDIRGSHEDKNYVKM